MSLYQSLSRLGLPLILCSMPPVLSDPALCKITYEALEKEVEKGVKDDAKREKAFGN